MWGKQASAHEGGLHEDLSREDEVLGSSDRAFGLTIAGFCGLVGGVRLALGHEHVLWWLAVSVASLSVGLLWPAALGPLNRLWLRLGLLLYKLINPIVMGLVFFATVMPIGLVMRGFGKDPLRLRRDSVAPSYWIPREPPGPATSMKNQF